MPFSIMRFVNLLSVAELFSLCSAQINLGDAAPYGIYGAASVTNTGPTIIDGDLGTGGTSVTGFGPGIINGNLVIGGATSQAFIDATAAFTDITNSIADVDLTGFDLGSRNLPPGTYNFDATAQLTGTLTLEGTGSPDDLWLFQIGQALTTATGSAVILVNGALACQVYWAVGSSVTLGTGASFVGTILAGASVTFDTAASLVGRAFGLSATVTLDSNGVVVPDCPVQSSSSSVANQSPTVAIPSLVSATPALVSSSDISFGTSSTLLSEVASGTSFFIDSSAVTLISSAQSSIAEMPSSTFEPSTSPSTIASTSIVLSPSLSMPTLASSASTASTLETASTISDSFLMSSLGPTISISPTPSLSETALLESSISHLSTSLRSSTLPYPTSLLASSNPQSSVIPISTSVQSSSFIQSSTLNTSSLGDSTVESPTFDSSTTLQSVSFQSSALQTATLQLPTLQSTTSLLSSPSALGSTPVPSSSSILSSSSLQSSFPMLSTSLSLSSSLLISTYLPIISSSPPTSSIHFLPATSSLSDTATLPLNFPFSSTSTKIASLALSFSTPLTTSSSFRSSTSSVCNCPPASIILSASVVTKTLETCSARSVTPAVLTITLKSTSKIMTTTYLFRPTQTQTVTVTVTVKDNAAINVARTSVKTSPITMTTTVNVTITTTLQVYLNSQVLLRSDINGHFTGSSTDGRLTDILKISRPCDTKSPIVVKDSSRHAVNEILAVIPTLTSCPHKAICTGQASTWIGSSGPLPCAAGSTCSCILPGGAQVTIFCPTNMRSTGPAKPSPASGKVILGAEGDACTSLLLETTNSLSPKIEELLSLKQPVTTEDLSEVTPVTITTPSGAKISPLLNTTSTPGVFNSGCSFSRRIGGFGIVATVLAMMYLL